MNIIKNIFIVMFIPFVLYPQVDIETIKSVGSNFLHAKTSYEKSTTTKTSQKIINYSDYSISELLPIIDPEDKSKTLAYVYELKPTGYVVIPNSKYLTPILAYSFSNNFNWEINSDNILYGMLLTDLKNRFNALNDNVIEQELIFKNNYLWQNYENNENLMGVTEAYPNENSGWISTSWGQASNDINNRDLYNMRCPDDPNTNINSNTFPGGSIRVDKNGNYIGGTLNGRSFTGCVATAMGQIINYWGEKLDYPSKVIFDQNDQYTSKYDPDDGYGERIIQISKSDANINNLNFPLSTDNEIADLLFACGVSIEMKYSDNGSATPTWNVNDALKKYFDYSQADEIYDGFGLYAPLIENMKYGLPAQLAIDVFTWEWGFYPKHSDGHSIVCDGYKIENSQNFFHLNFGHPSRNYNTDWYQLPDGMPSNFNNVKYGIVNILPKSKILSIDANNLIIDERADVKVKVIAPYSGEYFVKVINRGGILPPEWQWDSYSTTSKNLNIGEEHIFVLNVKPEDSSGEFVFLLYSNITGVGEVAIHNFEITLSAGTNNSGIDVALVLDKSGSMNFDNYMEPAKDAAKTFVGLMQTGDNVAVISFQSTPTVNFSLTQIVSDATKTNAQNAISQIYASGGTGMGGGIQTAQNELNKGDTSKRQGMVLLSDGYENNYPLVEDVLPNIPQTTGIYTIALGDNSDQVLLNNIAVATKAIYSHSPSTSDLQNIYNHIRAGVSGQQIVNSSSGYISVNQSNSHSVFVDNSINNITFSTVWAGSDLDLTLEDPNGNTINANNVNSLNGFFTTGNTYEYYTIPNPTIGEWKMKVLGVDVPTQDYEYTVSASANTNLTLATSFDQQLYGNGWPILITAELKENENPTTGAQVFAEVTIPTNPVPGAIASSEMSMIGKNGSVESESISSSVQLIKKGNQYYGTDGTLYYDAEMIQLFDDGQHNDRNANDGYYAATFTNTTQPGSYTFKVTAEGNNQAGQIFTRQSTQSTVVDPVQTPSIPILVSPSDGSDVNSSDVKFEWQASINADTYTLQVSEEQTFANVNYEETNITEVKKSMNLEKDKTYYWRVLASNASGSSGWSQVWSFNTSAYGSYKVAFTFSVEATCMETPYITKAQVVNTNDNFVIEPFTMPEFAKNWQILYDALVGTKFMIENGAIDENIELDIRVQQVSCENPGQYTDPSTFNNPLFLFLGIKVTGENSGITPLEDFYYFKNGKKAKICIPHNQEFLDFLSSLNMNIADLDFAYYLSDKYFKDGISQVQVSGKNGVVDSTCIYLEHFSQIAGGQFSKITDIENISFESPIEYSLHQNYPNPFNPTTTISYAIPSSGKVSLRIYDVLGKEVANLVDENKSAGNYSVKFNGTDLVSGIYFYKLQVNDFVETKKLLLIK